MAGNYPNRADIYNQMRRNSFDKREIYIYIYIYSNIKLRFLLIFNYMRICAGLKKKEKKIFFGKINISLIYNKIILR